jgi:hypothetical protein
MSHDMVNAAGRQNVDSGEIKGSIDYVTKMAEAIFDGIEQRQQESSQVVKELEQMRASAE